MQAATGKQMGKANVSLYHSRKSACLNARAFASLVDPELVLNE